jgi:2-C-methyl-D-erythritol 4-phosphate cytidylyltransferase
LAVPVSDTIKQVDGQDKVQATLSRKGLWLAQTPQVFRRDWLVEAYGKRGKGTEEITDDAQLVQAAGHSVHVVEGSASNIKITVKGDLALAEAILKSRPKPKPSGPAHPFAEEEMWGPLGPK